LAEKIIFGKIFYPDPRETLMPGIYTVTANAPSSFLSIAVIIATQTSGDNIKLKCADIERFHLDGKLQQNIGEFGLAMNAEMSGENMIFLEKTDEWNTMKDEWIVLTPPIV